MEETVKIIKATTDRIEFGGAAEVPFPEHARDVACIDEFISNRSFPDRQSGFRILVLGSDGIELIAETSLIAACHESSPRGATEGCCDVTLSESNAVPCQRIDIRCRDLWIALAPELTITQVIRDE